MKLYYGMKNSLHVNIIVDMSYVHDLKVKMCIERLYARNWCRFEGYNLWVHKLWAKV
jgi:hypothetical protein